MPLFFFRSQGYSVGTAATQGTFPQGTGDVLIKDISCSADDQSLTECTFAGWGETDGCTHAADAGAICGKPRSW